MNSFLQKEVCVSAFLKNIPDSIFISFLYCYVFTHPFNSKSAKKITGITVCINDWYTLNCKLVLWTLNWYFEQWTGTLSSELVLWTVNWYFAQWTGNFYNYSWLRFFWENLANFATIVLLPGGIPISNKLVLLRMIRMCFSQTVSIAFSFCLL